MKKRIYLDHNAAAPVDPRVIKAIESHLHKHTANASSIHLFGREMRKCLTNARDTIAECLKVKPEEVVFTSGGTEGANLVLRGLLHPNYLGHIITSSVEHSCVNDTVQELERFGCHATYLEPGAWGAVRPEQVEEALTSDTKLIAIMAANNETGVKTDIEGIAKIASEADVPLFVDGVALLGKERFQIPEGVSAMCFSGQKIHATQGAGFCFIRRRLKLCPMITGGRQEFGRRSGTENLPGIVGLAEAVAILYDEMDRVVPKIQRLRDRFESTLKEKCSNVVVNGEGPRVVNTSNLCFTGVDGETLLTALDLEGVAASHGSACSSGALGPSRVLLNMGLSRDRVLSSIRFSFSRFTTEEEIERAIDIIVNAVI